MPEPPAQGLCPARLTITTRGDLAVHITLVCHRESPHPGQNHYDGTEGVECEWYLPVAPPPLFHDT
jgi:hypothetical protein